MNTKILMIYPEFPVTFWSFRYSLSFIGKRAAHPPLGLLTVAALLPDNYEVKLIDMNVNKLHEEDILDADLIFISAMIIQKESMNEVIRRCKDMKKEIVIGGPYPTLLQGEIKGVDYFILNEAETTLGQFINDYEKGNPKRIYQDTMKPDITKTPVPRFDLLDMNQYSSMALQFSRGCPFNCEFCDIIEIFGRKSRTKTPEQFVKELSSLYDLGYRGQIFIVDDNFIGNKKQVKRLLRLIDIWQKEHGFPFSFSTEASVNLSEDDELLSLMKSVRFNMVFLGIETPVEESLLMVNKKQNTQSNLAQSVKIIQQYGIKVTGGFIVGFDNDPENIFDLQKDFIMQSAIPVAMVGLLTVIPNTQLYRRLESEHRILNKVLGNNTHNLELNYLPIMNKHQLLSGYKHLLQFIYKPANYFQRCLHLLKRLPKTSSQTSHLSFKKVVTGLKALFLSFFRQTFSFYGGQYLKYLFQSFVHSRVLFPEAISLAVLGHHLFIITKELLIVDKVKSYIEESITLFVQQSENISLEKDSIEQIKKYKHQLTDNINNKYKKLKTDMKKYIDVHILKFNYVVDNIILEKQKRWLLSQGYTFDS